MTNQPRSEQEIRADVAVLDAAESWSEAYHDAVVRLLHDVEPLLAHIAAMGEPDTEWGYALGSSFHEATEFNAKYVTHANEHATLMSRQVRRTEWLPVVAEGVLVEPQDTGGEPE